MTLRSPAKSPNPWTIRHAQANERLAIEAHLTETWIATYAGLVGRAPVEDLLSDMANSYRLLLGSLGEDPNRQVFIFLNLLSVKQF